MEPKKLIKVLRRHVGEARWNREFIPHHFCTRVNREQLNEYFAKVVRDEPRSGNLRIFVFFSCGNEAFLLVKNMRKGVDYVGVSICYFCHDGKGNFVMAKRSENCRDEHGKWDTGGGALEFGDDVLERLKKEIKEEYLTDVLDCEFLGYDDVHREHGGKKTHWVALLFKVLVDREKVQIGEPHKFSDIGWFTLDTLPDNLHSSLPNFFKKYKDKLI